jgi:hypothetical protein
MTKWSIGKEMCLITSVLRQEMLKLELQWMCLQPIQEIQDLLKQLRIEILRVKQYAFKRWDLGLKGWKLSVH